MRIRPVISGMVLLALVGGCSSTSTPTAGSPTAASSAPAASSPTASTTEQASDDVPDPCSLLTSAEVSAATGMSFGDGETNTLVSQDGIDVCDWHGPGIDTVQVLVSPITAYGSSKQTASEVYGVEDVSVPGATSAYVAKGGFLIGMDLSGTFLQVSYISAGKNVAGATLTLATAAAGRLG